MAKQLFGTAVKCGRPDCNELLLRMENGRPALNCRIAHIRASAPTGPRADSFMTCAEVNAFDNLILLCLFDASLVDDSWEDFPVETLSDWKRQQIKQSTLIGVSRQPTDDEITELIVESRQHDSVTRSASVDLARSVRQLQSAAERTRTEPQEILRERQQVENELNRGFLGFDSETGERAQMRLSPSDERRFARRIAEALGRSRVPVEAAGDAVLAEAAGVAAATGGAANEARGWVERAVVDVVRAAAEWNDQFGETLHQLNAASSALLDVAAGRAAYVPPPPEPPASREPSALELFITRSRDVHERAARHLRVDHLPFDAELHDEVVQIAATCAAVPTVVTFMGFASDNNAALAAAILKNTDDEQFRLAVDAAATLQPEAAAAHHLRHLHFLASERGWTERVVLVRAAVEDLSARIVEQFGSHEFWERNVEHGSFVLQCCEGTVGAEAVTAALASALTDPTLIEPLLVALSETVENQDSTTLEFLGITRRYSDPRGPIKALPQEFSVSVVCAAIELRWPAGPNVRGPEAERLGAEFHAHRCAPDQTT